MHRVLVTGATGFIGSHVARELTGTAPELSLRLLRRSPDKPRSRATDEKDRTRVVHGDLAEPGTLRGVCDDVHTVLHLASYIGSDTRLCHDVNVVGTRALLDEARRAGVERFVQLSTAAVYGRGQHDHVRENEITPRPESPTSRSRREAEKAVLADGGIVLRPYLVYGTGDVWVVPTLAGLLRRLPAWVDGGRARMSLIDVSDLARLIVGVVLDRGRAIAPGAYHASHPVPTTARELLTALATHLDITLPTTKTTPEQAHAMLGADQDPQWAHHLTMLTRHHSFDSDHLWQALGLNAGPGFAARLPTHREWYRSTVPGLEHSA